MSVDLIVCNACLHGNKSNVMRCSSSIVWRCDFILFLLGFAPFWTKGYCHNIYNLASMQPYVFSYTLQFAGQRQSSQSSSQSEHGIYHIPAVACDVHVSGRLQIIHHCLLVCRNQNWSTDIGATVCDMTYPQRRLRLNKPRHAPPSSPRSLRLLAAL